MTMKKLSENSRCKLIKTQVTMFNSCCAGKPGTVIIDHNNGWYGVKFDNGHTHNLPESSLSEIQGPMPKVEFEGRTYSLTSRKTVVPNLFEMSSLEVHMWLIRHTRAQGYCKPDNPLTGIGGAITVN